MIELSQMTIAILSGLGIAIASGLLGMFVITQRLSFFSDALSHAALLGVSFSLLLSLPHNISFVVTALVFACIFWWVFDRTHLSSDTLIGVLSHSFLAISLLCIELFSHDHSDHASEGGHDHAHVDLEHFLFGDLNTIDSVNLFWVGLCLLLVGVFVYRNWQALLLSTLHSDLAKAEGINTARLKLITVLLLALLVAISIQLVGALLISALLIIPASAASLWGRSPKLSVLIACAMGCIAVLIGLGMASSLHVSAGPSIVSIALVFFILSLLMNRVKP